MLVLATLLRTQAAPISVTVQPDVRHQTIEGFGASISAWSAQMYRIFYDEEWVDFAANELGQSVFRLQMWGGVSPREIEDWHDISHREFDWTTDGLRGKANIDFARNLVAANPEVRVIASVWSAPAWMKENGGRTGTRAGFLLDPKRDFDRDNRLREDRYHHFAKWVVEWARLLEEQGTPMYAVSLQNEPMFTQWFESTLYTPNEYAEIVRVTGEMFESEGVSKPLFFGPEDMTMATYADAERHKPYVDALMRPEVARYFDVFATHGYSDGVRADALNNVGDYARTIARFGRPYWITEGGSGEHMWPLPVTTGIGPRLHMALTAGNVSLFCGWQLASLPGRASDREFMDGNHATAKTYTAMHFWRHIRPGAVRVDVATPSDEDLLVSAFVHDRRAEAVTVLINRSTEVRDVALEWGDSVAGDWQAWQTSATQRHEAMAGVATENGRLGSLHLPGPSITTVVGRLAKSTIPSPVAETAAQSTYPDPIRFAKEIDAFRAADSVALSEPGGVLCLGSSSMGRWTPTIREDLAPLRVIPRGFGGSNFNDVDHYFERLVLPYAPRAILLYEGENDLAIGISPERVIQRFEALVVRVHRYLPECRIYVISVKPSPSRAEIFPKIMEANARIAEICARDKRLQFIDVAGAMVDEQGQVRADIFSEDNLHMNRAGYEIWRDIVQATMVAVERSYEP